MSVLNPTVDSKAKPVGDICILATLYFSFLCLGIGIGIGLEYFVLDTKSSKDLFAIVTQIGEDSHKQNTKDFFVFFINNVLVTVFLFSSIVIAQKLKTAFKPFVAKWFLLMMTIGSLIANVYAGFSIIGRTTGVTIQGKLHIMASIYGPHLFIELLAYSWVLTSMIRCAISEKYVLPSRRDMFIIGMLFLIAALIEGFGTPLFVKAYWS